MEDRSYQNPEKINGVREEPFTIPMPTQGSVLLRLQENGTLMPNPESPEDALRNKFYTTLIDATLFPDEARAQLQEVPPLSPAAFNHTWKILTARETGLDPAIGMPFAPQLRERYLANFRRDSNALFGNDEFTEEAEKLLKRNLPSLNENP